MINRTLHPELEGAPIRRLEEPYPENGCSEFGQLAQHSQFHYSCRSDHFENGEYFRVTKDDFEILSDFPDDFLCKKELVHKNVCMCKPGQSDYLCETAAQPGNQSCYVNITNPPLYKGCNGTDSNYYLYSLGGFAPCYFYDFTKTYTFDVLIQCKVFTNNTLKLMTGYQYRDVV